MKAAKNSNGETIRSWGEGGDDPFFHQQGEIRFFTKPNMTER